MPGWPLTDASRPLVFAHRGGAALAPENTLAAFQNGLALGADGLELDVRLSRDGVAVVHHDRTLERTTDSSGPVEHRTAAELARLDAGYHFASDRGHPFRGRGASIPRLAEILQHCPSVPIIVELKGTELRLVQTVVDDVRQAGATERVCLGGYSVRLLRNARLLNRGIATSAGREEVRWALYRSWIGWARRSPYRAFQIPEWAGRTRVVSPRFVAVAHRADLSVQVWTVDEPDDMTRLLRWGVDGLISDRPDLAVPVRNQWIAESKA
jgi:glycerophosphoryl diester phosphodiesterase